MIPNKFDPESNGTHLDAHLSSSYFVTENDGRKKARNHRAFFTSGFILKKSFSTAST